MSGTVVGRVEALWRYPVKSMLGESLQLAPVTEAGLCGDRAYALWDHATDRVASAKNPRLRSSPLHYRGRDRSRPAGIAPADQRPPGQ